MRWWNKPVPERWTALAWDIFATVLIIGFVMFVGHAAGF